MKSSSSKQVGGRLPFWSAMVLLLVGLPLAGCLLQGKPLAPYLSFPPLTRETPKPGFSWAVFLLFAAVNSAMLAGIFVVMKNTLDSSRPRKAPPAIRFPAWGWIGLGVMLTGWLLAWTRFAWFSAVQQHTFCLPWIGYILLVNALCQWRSATCLLTETPVGFVLLFPASALFWWFFEYLNRFVQNWHYIGVEGFTPLAYTLFASLAFATVLPAVLSTYRLLLTAKVFARVPSNGPSLCIRRCSGRTAAALLLPACAGLVLLEPLADYLFALVWAAPFLLIVGLQLLFSRPTVLDSLEDGNWTPVAASATAALICGFFWELWNAGSLAQWAYTVPFADRYHLFAMPVAGYGGYLPFGIECLAVGHLFMGSRPLGLRAP